LCHRISTRVRSFKNVTFGYSGAFLLFSYFLSNVSCISLSTSRFNATGFRYSTVTAHRRARSFSPLASQYQCAYIQIPSSRMSSSSVRIIIFLVMTGASEYDLLLKTVAIHLMIDERSIVIRINAQQIERETPSYLLHCFKHPLLRLAEHCFGFKPLSMDIGSIKRMCKVSGSAIPTMCDKIHFLKSRLFLVPFTYANRYLTLQQCSWFSSAVYLLVFSLSHFSQQPFQRSQLDMNNFCFSDRIEPQYTKCTKLLNHFLDIRMYTFSVYTIICIPESG
jgi:hypothetical protein